MHTSQTDTAPCEDCKDGGPEEYLICAVCGKVLVSVSSRIAVLLFVLSSLVAILLFRYTSALWPIYSLTVLGIVQLYSLVFSKGKTLIPSVAATAFLTTLWVLLTFLLSQGANTKLAAVLTDILGVSGQRIHISSDLLTAYIISIGFFTSVMIWVLILGGSAIKPLQSKAGWFLGVGSFTFGLWGVWGTLLEQGFTRRLLSESTVFIALAAPLVILITLIRIPKDVKWAQFIVPWLWVFTAYLGSAELLTQLIEKGATSFLPRLLELPAPSDFQLPAVFGLLRWRTPVSVVFVAASFVSLLASSFVTAVKEFDEPRPGWYSGNRRRLLEQRATSTNEIERSYTEIMMFCLELLNKANALVVLFRSTLWILIGLLITAWLRAATYGRQLLQILIIPVSAFSVLSLSLMFLLTRYRLYFAGNPQGRLALWGETLTFLALVIVLCGLSLSVLPGWRRHGREVSKAIFMIGGEGFLLVSLGALVLLPLVWLGFKSVAPFARELRPSGPSSLYVFNAVPFILILLSLLLANIRPFSSWRPDRFLFAAFLFPGVIALVFGLPPIVSALWAAR